MADPRAFISFDFDNNSTEKTLFVGQIKNSKTPFSVEDWSSKSALPQAQWEAKLKAKIGAGGALKDGRFELQGDHRDAVRETFEALGFTIRG